MVKETDKHLDDLYDTSKLKIPGDYGTATCLNCGWGLNQLLQCVNCHATYDAAEVMFYVDESNRGGIAQDKGSNGKS